MPTAEKLAELLPNFLRYGPIGLAAIVLLLTIVALSAGKLSAAKASLLKNFLYAGVACFVLAAILGFFSDNIFSPKVLYLQVYPMQLEDSGFPQPRVSVNDQVLTSPVHYQLRSDVTAIVDVSRAINLLRKVYENANVKDAGIVQINGQLAEISARLKSLPAIQCSTGFDPGQIIRGPGGFLNGPGGGGGPASPYSPAIIAAIQKVDSVRAIAESLAQIPAPTKAEAD